MKTSNGNAVVRARSKNCGHAFSEKEAVDIINL